MDEKGVAWVRIRDGRGAYLTRRLTSVFEDDLAALATWASPTPPDLWTIVPKTSPYEDLLFSRAGEERRMMQRRLHKSVEGKLRFPHLKRKAGLKQKLRWRVKECCSSSTVLDFMHSARRVLLADGVRVGMTVCVSLLYSAELKIQTTNQLACLLGGVPQKCSARGINQAEVSVITGKMRNDVGDLLKGDRVIIMYAVGAYQLKVGFKNTLHTVLRENVSICSCSLAYQNTVSNCELSIGFERTQITVDGPIHCELWAMPGMAHMRMHAGYAGWC